MAVLEWLTEHQKQCFEKLIAAKYISTDGYKCEWGGSTALLAYAMGKIFCKSNKKGEFPETILNEMFGVKRLGQALHQVYGNKTPPRGHDGIDRLCL